MRSARARLAGKLLAATAAAGLTGVAIVALLIGALQTEAGANLAARELSRILSQPGATVIDIEGLRVRGLSRISLASVTVGDIGRESARQWVRLDGIDIVWRPLDLLTAGRLAFESVHIDDATIGDPPAAGTKPAAGGGWPPALPMAIRSFGVDRMTIRNKRLELPVEATVRGHIWLDRRGGDGELEASWRSGAGGRAHAILAFGDGRQPLTLYADIRDGAGGFLARLLGFPTAPEIALQVAGSAAPGLWKGNVVGIVDGAEFLAADIDVAPADAYEVKLAGTLTLPPEIGTLVDPSPNPRVTFAASASVRPGEAIDDVAISLTAAAGRAEASGDIGLADATLAGRFSVEIGALSAIPAVRGVAGGAVAVSGTLSGTYLAPRVAGEFRIDSPTWPTGGARAATGSFEAAVRSVADTSDVKVSLAVHVLGAATGQAPLDRLLGDDAAIDIAAIVDAVSGAASAIDVSFTGIQVAGRASASLSADGVLDISSIGVTVRDSAALASLVGLPIGGGLAADGKMQVRVSDGRVDGHVGLKGERFRWGDATLDALLGGEPEIGADMVFDPRGGLTLSSIVGRAGQTEIAGAFRLAATFDAVESRIAVKVAALDGLPQARAHGLGGSIIGDVRLAGPPGAPRLDLSAHSPLLTVGAERIADVRLTASAVDLTGDPSGQWALSGAWRNERLVASARYRLRQLARLALVDVRLAGFGGAARGGFDIDLAKASVEGEMEGELPSVAGLAGIPGIAADGKADFRLRLSVAKGIQRLDGDLRLTALGISDQPTRLTVATASATAAIGDPFGEPRGRVDVDVTGLRAGAVSLDRWTLSLDGTSNAVAFRTAATQQNGTPLELRSHGTLARTPGGFRLVTDALDGGYGGLSVLAKKPFRLEAGAAGYSLDGLDLDVGQGRITASAVFGTGRPRAEIAVRGLPLASVAAVIPELPLDGTLEASLIVGDPGRQALGDGTVTLSGVRPRLAGYEDLPATDIAGRVSWNATRLELNVEGRGLAAQPLKARLVLPVATGAGFPGLAVASDGALEGSLAGAVDLDYLAPFVTAAGDSLRGVVTIDGRLGGRVGTPQPSGRAVLSGGHYENAATGLLLRNIEAVVEAEGGALVVRDLKADDGGGGVVLGSGRIDLAAAGTPFDLGLTMQGLAVLRRDDAGAVVDGGIQASGNRQAARLEGRVAIRNAEFRIPDRLAAAIVDLDVVEVHGARSEGYKRDEAGRRSGPYPVALDATLTFADRVFVRGRGLESEWRGDFAVGGSIEEPQVSGTASLVRGRFDLLGKVFTLDQGVVRLDEDGIPVLDVSGEAAKPDLSVRVRIHGPATSPAIDLTSRPELPPDEILARLLFDKRAGQLTALEAVQLASAAAQLSGKGGGADFLDKVRRGLGVDRLSVSPGATGVEGASINVGKYVAEGVFVSVGGGAQSGSERITVEIDVTPNVSVETDVGADARNSIGVNWHWDY